MSEIALDAIKAERSLTDQVRESILAAIVEGKLAPGSLYSVQALADAFQVSRTPVREALITLSRQGMVEFERNRGVRILQTSIHDLEEILTLRLLLEVPAAHRAADQPPEEMVKALKGELSAMERAAKADDELTMMRHDRRFHELLNRGSGNGRLAEFVDSLRDQVLTRGISTVGRSRSLSTIVSEHRKIMDAVEAGDAKAAGKAMKEHLVNTASLLLKQEGGPEAGRMRWSELVVG
jgi:DNA-binding GntR family transcriptional regulator